MGSRISLVLIPVVLVAGILLAAPRPGGGAGALRGDVLPILSTTDAVGKVTPCGCHTPKGGLARIASLIDSTKQKYGDALVVEAGDFAPDPRQPEERARIGFYLDMLAKIGYDAVGVGERELAFGVDELVARAKDSKLPVLSANLVEKKDGRALFRRSVIVTKGGIKVGIFSVLGAAIELPANAGEHLRIDEPVAVAQKVVAELREKADVVVCLAHLGRVDGENLATEVPGIDVIILGHHPGFVAEGRRIGSTITVASGEQIQNMGVTRLTMAGRKVTDLASEVRILLPEVGERADIAAAVKTFEDGVNEQIQKANKVSAVESSAPQPGEDHYLGSAACADCHQPQYEHWQTTQHAHAFATLERVQKDATPECVQCHVVGFGRPGGYENARKSMKLQNVGCESCHGYGTQHDMLTARPNGIASNASTASTATTAAAGKVAEAVCVTCHTPANDPGWSYAAKLPRVSH